MAHLISFHDLKQQDLIQKGEKKDIEIRGFVYHHDGQWILAAEPNLKSCCIGSHPKILLQGDLPKKFHAGLWHLKGQLSHNSSFYNLENIIPIEETSPSIRLLGILFILGVFVLFFLKRIRRTR